MPHVVGEGGEHWPAWSRARTVSTGVCLRAAWVPNSLRTLHVCLQCAHTPPTAAACRHEIRRKEEDEILCSLVSEVETKGGARVRSAIPNDHTCTISIYGPIYELDVEIGITHVHVEL